MPGKDYYNVLGVRRDATEQEIKQAYRRLARKYHPDLNPGDKSAEDRFKKINEAYEILSSTEKRQKYDKFGDDWENASQFGGRPGGAGPAHGGGQPFTQNWEFTDFPGGATRGFETANSEGTESILDELLHGMRGTRRRPRPTRGKDIESPIEISLEEAASGTTRTISLRADEPCPTCQGTGRIRNADCSACRGAGVVTRIRRLEVKIPAGVTDASRVRVAGQGQPGYGGPSGDLYLVTSIRKHPTFERRGHDLYVDVGIPLYLAVLGGEVQVPTLRGKLALRIPPETQNGRAFRLTGQGMPHLGDTTSGDMLARVNIILPTRLTAEEKELFRRLAELRPSA